jgi:hypothetical protein
VREIQGTLHHARARLILPQYFPSSRPFNWCARATIYWTQLSVQGIVVCRTALLNAAVYRTALLNVVVYRTLVDTIRYTL